MAKKFIISAVYRIFGEFEVEAESEAHAQTIVQSLDLEQFRDQSTVEGMDDINVTDCGEEN